MTLTPFSLVRTLCVVPIFLAVGYSHDHPQQLRRYLHFHCRGCFIFSV